VPLNLDGAIAVVFAAIGYPPEIANPLFTIGRFVGLNAQAWEETTRMRPMRAIHPRGYDYDGPGERHLDGAA
jgi:citrate synthase